MADRWFVVIADDEDLARARLRRLLEAYPDLEIVAEAGNGAELTDALASTPIDLLLLDIEMPGPSVFDALAAAQLTPRPDIIFVTAFDRYAARAFEIEAVDYLLKPVTRERLAEALERVRRRRLTDADGEHGWRRALLALEARQAHLERALQSTPAAPARLLVRRDGRDVIVDLADAEAIEAARNYVKIHTASGEQHLARVALSTVEAGLDPTRFVRVHRGTIVNLAWLKEVQPWFSGDSIIITKRGRQFRMSRRFRDNFYRLFRTSPSDHS